MTRTFPIVGGPGRYQARWRGLLGCLLLQLVACTPDFDEVWLVRDLRILAMRADPPEVLVDLRAMPPTFPEVTVSALVVDPRDPDRVVDWELWACTTEATGCEEAAQRQLVAADRTPLSAIEARFALSDTLFAAALTEDPLLGLGGVPLLVELQIAADDETVQGIKRLVYGTPEPPRPQQTAGAWGGPCRADAPQCIPGTHCDPDQQRCLKHPNQNPQITEVLDATDGEEPESVKEPIPSGGWQLPSSETVVLEPLSPDADKEPYVTDTLLKGTKELEEFLTYSFYVTAGELSHATTGGRPSPFVDLKKVTDLTSDWTPEDPAASDTDPVSPRQQVWIVVRDDRGGVGWWSADATITPAP